MEFASLRDVRAQASRLQPARGMDHMKQLPDHFLNMKGNGDDGEDPWRPPRQTKHSHDEDGEYNSEYDEDDLTESVQNRKGNKNVGATKLGGKDKRRTEKDSLGSSVGFFKDRDNRKQFHQDKQQIQSGGKSLPTSTMKQYAQTGVLNVGPSLSTTSKGTKTKGTGSGPMPTGPTDMSDVFGDTELVEPTPAIEVASTNEILSDLFGGYTNPKMVSNKDPSVKNLEEDFM